MRSVVHFVPLALFATLALSTSGCPGEGGPDGDAPTYYTDIQPIVQTHCTRCHFEGGLGVGDFTDPSQVEQFGEAMAIAVEAGRMPPAASDPGCRDYDASEHLFIDDADKTTIRAWVDGGKQMGDEADAVDGITLDASLPGANKTFRMPAEYAPNFNDPSFPGNEYRCFVLENDETEDFWVTGLAPEIGNQAIAHHIVLSRIDKNANLPAHEAAEGFECANFNILDGMMGGWAPGMAPVELPEGHGLRVQPSENLIMQMHYFDSQPGQAMTDRSGYSFVTTTDNVNQVLMLPIGSYQFNIPAGDDNYAFTESYSLAEIGLPVNVQAFGVFPHMHVLGKSYRYWVEHPDGSTTCLSESDGYDFENQMTYVWKEPITLAPDDRLHWECVWNNSTSNPDRVLEVPVNTGFGEGTDEEMCFFFTYGAVGG